MTAQIQWLVKGLLVSALLALAAGAAHAARDFNGDGRSDILWRNSATGENNVYLMNGTAVVGEGYLPTVSNQSWRIVGVGDFNGDGRSDILWRNAATGENYVYLINGTAIAGEGYLRTVPDQSWRIVDVGDLNGDGRSDILWRNAATGENYAYLMNGITIAGEGYLRTVPDQSWRIIGVGDLNGDGRADILWRNAATGENYAYLMNGTAIAGEGYLRTVTNTAWDVVQVEDFDGDGRADILWRNSSSGENYLYLMSGTSIVGEGYLRTVADQNWRVMPSTGGDTTPPSTPAWVNALAIGQWYSIPNTAMSSVAPSPTPGGNSGPLSKVYAWTSFVVDTRTSKVYSVANGGHQDYAGNEVDTLDLERDQPVWSQVLAPTPNASIPPLDACQSYYNDGRPAARHTYYGVTLNEFDDRIMLFGGVHWCGPGSSTNTISSYNIGTNSYNGAGTHPDLSNVFRQPSIATALNPLTGDVYVSRSGELGVWNRSSNTFTLKDPSGSAPFGYLSMSAFDTARGRFLVLGGESSDRHLYTISTDAWTQITLSGPAAANVMGHGRAMVYVAAIDRFLVRGGSSGGTVYQINPATFEVTTLATTNGSSVPSTQNGPYNKFLYVPRLGGAVYVPSYTGNAWFLRIH
jgi:hypothetical protein